MAKHKTRITAKPILQPKAAKPAETASPFAPTKPAKPATPVQQPTNANDQPPIANTDQPIWQRHVFVCTSGSWCPVVDGDGLGVHARLKALVAEAGLKATTRVNHSGCFDQCGFGPMVVIYPENVWYWGVQPEDVDEIVREHLIGGRPVERLRYHNTPGKHKLPRDADGKPVGRPARAGAARADA